MNRKGDQPMIVKVRMIAHEEANIDRYTVRLVEVPDEEIATDDSSISSDLERVFWYGQNGVQNKQCCSVSAGDVIEYAGGLYKVGMMGFFQITEDEFYELVKLSRTDRLMAYITPHWRKEKVNETI
jgi:hypothetical protein